MDFTGEEMTQQIIEVYKATKDKFQIDGFRKGKAPRSIIEKQYGEYVFVDDALNNLITEAYGKLVSENDLEVVDEPSMDFSDFKKDADFTVTGEVALFPIVDVKDYKGIEVEQTVREVTDEDVERELENRRNRNARIQVVERAAADGDHLILDYAGFVGEHQFDGGTAEKQTLVLGSQTFIPGFEEQLVGVSAGEEKDVVVTFPEEYHAPDLAGKEAVFKCKVHEVKEKQLPELDDEFAKDVSDFDTLDELKADIRKQMEESAQLIATEEAKDKVLVKVTENNPLGDDVVRESMVMDEINRMVQEVDQQLRYQGLSFNQYMQMMGKKPEDIIEELKEDAKKRVERRIVVRSVGVKEAIVASDEDMEKDLKQLAEAYRSDVEGIKGMLGEEGMKMFKLDVTMKMIIDFLYENAKVETKTVKPEELNK